MWHTWYSPVTLRIVHSSTSPHLRLRVVATRVPLLVVQVERVAVFGFRERDHAPTDDGHAGMLSAAEASPRRAGIAAAPVAGPSPLRGSPSARALDDDGAEPDVRIRIALRPGVDLTRPQRETAVCPTHHEHRVSGTGRYKRCVSLEPACQPIAVPGEYPEGRPSISRSKKASAPTFPIARPAAGLSST